MRNTPGCERQLIQSKFLTKYLVKWNEVTKCCFSSDDCNFQPQLTCLHLLCMPLLKDRERKITE